MTRRKSPSSPAAPLFNLPDRTILRQALDLSLLSAAFAVLFNLFYPGGIELKHKSSFSTPPPRKARAATVTPEYTGWGKRPQTPVAKPSPQAQVVPGFPQISLMGAKKLFDEKRAVFLDGRRQDEYLEGHVPGAFHIEVDKFAEQAGPVLAQIRPDQEIVSYCHGVDCELSTQLAEKLKAAGYPNVKVFTGGWPDWKKAGYPVTAGANP